MHSFSSSSITCSSSHLSQFAVFSEEQEVEEMKEVEEEDGARKEGEREERGGREKRNTNDPNKIEIADVRTLVIGVSITGTITLVVILTAILIS